MKYPVIWDGESWRKSTKEEYEKELVNVPVYGKANYLFRDVWELPKVDTNLLTGSKVVACGRSVQLRFSCARTTDTAKAVRAYKLALDKDARAGVQFNYSKTSSVFTFETTFCGSASGLKKFEAFINKLASLSSVKSLQVRMRDETTGETSAFKKFPYNNITLNVVRYLRDNLTIKDYNKVIVKNLKVTPGDNIYGVKVTL